MLFTPNQNVKSFIFELMLQPVSITFHILVDLAWYIPVCLYKWHSIHWTIADTAICKYSDDRMMIDCDRKTACSSGKALHAQACSQVLAKPNGKKRKKTYRGSVSALVNIMDLSWTIQKLHKLTLTKLMSGQAHCNNTLMIR